MRKFFLTLTLTGIFSCLTYSQETDRDRDRFGFNVGLEYHQVREQLLNGLVHRGISFNLGGIYLHSSISCNHGLEINAGFGILKTRMEEESETFLSDLRINYHYNHRVVSLGLNGGIYLGGVMDLDQCLGIYQNWDENHFYWLTSYSLGLNGLLLKDIQGKSRISFDFDVPVIALVSRSPSERFLHEDIPVFSYILSTLNERLVLTTWPEHVSFRGKVGYTPLPAKRVQPTIYWETGYARSNISTSAKFTSLSHSIGLMLLF